MNKTTFMAITITLLSLELNAQRVEYFSSIPADSVSVKSIQGLSFQTKILTDLERTIYPISIGYFYEQKIGKSTTIIFSGNFKGLRSVKSVTDIMDENGNIIKQDFSYGFGLHLNASIEPRWYFDYINRSLNGRNTNLNSGFFLGLPLELGTNQMNFGNQIQFNFTTTPLIGFRYAFTNAMFLESHIGVSIYPFDFKNTPSNLNIGLKASYKL